MTRLNLSTVLLAAILCGWVTAGAGFANDNKKKVDPPPPPPTILPAPAPLVPVKMLTAADVDQLVSNELYSEQLADPADESTFLRRVTLDLIGRQPRVAELDSFLQAHPQMRRQEAIERLLDDPGFGRRWADYWSDTISFHVIPPELTFLVYEPFKGWLADQINANRRWDHVVQDILTGTGMVGENPPATFVAYHQGNPVKLAAETARVFLGLQIQCAECHDHPFDDWKREEFHHLAAFYARTSVKMPWNEGAKTEVKDAGKGSYFMPNAADPQKPGTEMAPAVLGGIPMTDVTTDLERRQMLARFVAGNENSWFAQAFVNRMWAELLGEGFYEPVDNVGQYQPHSLPQTHEALRQFFVGSGFDTKALVRIIVNSKAYQRGLPSSEKLARVAYAAARPNRLSGDQLFRSLVTSIELPNVKPKPTAPTKGVRFPPPPKSTRDLVADAFNFDPALRPDEVPRTMQQAMLLMNNAQLQAQIDARPESKTVLSRLLVKYPDNDDAVIDSLYRATLARKPHAEEVSLAHEHLASVGDRSQGFEDLLWALLNSTEFSSRR